MTHLNDRHHRRLKELFLWSMATIFTLSILSFVFRWGLTFWLSFIAALVTCAALVVKLWLDNRHVRISVASLISLFGISFVFWLPLGLLLLPGFMGMRWIDAQLDRGVAYAHKQVADKVREEEVVNERIIKENHSFWLLPWTWGRFVEKKVRETAVRTVVDKASIGTRILFAWIYTTLRCLQYFYYTCFALVVVRSFGYVLARAAVRRENGLTFTLPRAR